MTRDYKMCIGIDLDDTIINTFEDLMQFFSKYFNLDINYCIENKYSYNNFPDDLKDRKLEFIEYLKHNKLINKISLKDKAKEAINFFHENGFKILIITSRNDNILPNAYNETKKYLDDNEIIYDKLFCEHDKHRILLEEKVDIFIDDSIKGLNYNVDVCKHEILFNSILNNSERTNFIRATSWNDVTKEIMKLQKNFELISEIKFIDKQIIKNVLFSLPKREYEEVDYMIIFGCHLKSIMNERLNKAIEIYNNKKIDKIIITGGIGKNGNYNESDYMLNYLIRHKVSIENIIIEEKSTTTEENIVNVFNMLGDELKNKKVILLSSEPHLRRIGMEIQKQYGTFNNVLIYEYPDNSELNYEKIITDNELYQLAKNEINKIKLFISNGLIDDEEI